MLPKDDLSESDLSLDKDYPQEKVSEAHTNIEEAKSHYRKLIKPEGGLKEVIEEVLPRALE